MKTIYIVWLKQLSFDGSHFVKTIARIFANITKALEFVNKQNAIWAENDMLYFYEEREVE